MLPDGLNTTDRIPAPLVTVATQTLFPEDMRPRLLKVSCGLIVRVMLERNVERSKVRVALPPISIVHVLVALLQLKLTDWLRLMASTLACCAMLTMVLEALLRLDCGIQRMSAVPDNVARMAMMPIMTRDSTKVKPWQDRCFFCRFIKDGGFMVFFREKVAAFISFPYTKIVADKKYFGLLNLISRCVVQEEMSYTFL